MTTLSSGGLQVVTEWYVADRPHLACAAYDEAFWGASSSQANIAHVNRQGR